MWHVDYSKISYVDEMVVRDIVEKIENKFRDMRSVHGIKQEFLGMKLEHRTDRNFIILIEGL